MTNDQFEGPFIHVHIIIRWLVELSSFNGTFCFYKALQKRWRNLGLSNAPRRILTLAMALPLAPAEYFNAGLDLLTRLGDEIANDHPRILVFMHYMRRFWSPLAEVVSVHNCPVRTNNLVESFHNEAKRKLGGIHPNIWRFIGMLLPPLHVQVLTIDNIGPQKR